MQINQKPLKLKVSLTLDSDIVADYKMLAEEDSRSLSQYVNMVLRKQREHLKEKPNTTEL